MCNVINELCICVDPMDLPLSSVNSQFCDLWSAFVIWNFRDLCISENSVLYMCYLNSVWYVICLCDLKIQEIYVSLKILCYICVMLCDHWKFLYALKQRCPENSGVDQYIGHGNQDILFFQCIMNNILDDHDSQNGKYVELEEIEFK